MSYFSISNFIDSGRKSLENENYWSALSVALMLPSMCSRLKYADDSRYYDIKEDGHKHWHDKNSYIAFCNECFEKNGWLKCCLGQKYAEILYQLRCDIVHAGVADIYADGKGIYLALGELFSSSELSKFRIVDVKALSEEIFESITNWCSGYGANNFKYTYVFDMKNNYEDKLLYEHLRDKDKAARLEEQFNKENEERMKGRT